MTIKAIMVDVDGVLIDPPDGGWSVDLKKDCGLSAETLQADFFAHHWDDVIHGRASLRERLEPVLHEIAPHLTCDALIDYWFTHDAHVNETLLEELASLRAEGLEVHLATVQEHERARYIWEQLGFRSKFDRIHYSAELGCSKPSISFYKTVEVKCGFGPQELFFIDDKPANVEGALLSGWAASLWTGRNTVRSLCDFRPSFDLVKSEPKTSALLEI